MILEKLFGTHKYLFADLDGTLIKTKSGKTFPEDKDDWVLRGEVIQAIRKYKPEFLFIVSNQGGIEKGYMTTRDFLDKIRTIATDIRSMLRGAYNHDELGIAYRFCASNDKKNPNRKPNAGMVEELLNTYMAPRHQCLMIGDASGKEGQFSDSDKMCAFNANIKYMDVEDFVEKYK